MLELHSGSFIKLYIGCMFSSKTSSLLSEINRYKHITDNIIVINHVYDSQRHQKNIINSHDNFNIPAILLNTLYNVVDIPLFQNSDIVIIDEAQFFSDLYDFLYHYVNNTQNKPKLFIVAGLSGDYQMKPIGDIIKLIPICNEIHKLNAYCIYCKNGTPASFTKRLLNNDNEQILIGNNDIYAPVCRKHWLNF